MSSDSSMEVDTLGSISDKVREDTNVKVPLEKKRRWRDLSMIRVLEIEDIRTTIVSFCSPSSYFPLLYLSMTPVGWKDEKYFADHFSNSLFEVGTLNSFSIENLHLLRWHCESCQRMKSIGAWKGYPQYKSPTIMKRITPYDPSSSIEDLDFYFQFVHTIRWKEIKEGRKTDLYDHEFGQDMDHIQDAIIVAEDRGFIEMESVGRDSDNIIRPILAGRWDIADKYIRRGDMVEHYGWGIVKNLSLDQLSRLIHTYDLRKILEDVDTGKEVRICLLRGGILPCGLLRDDTRYDVAAHLPVPLSEVPMNVVEDLFTITLLRGTEYAGRLDLDFSVSDYAEETFFSLLKSDKKSTSASATHRKYKISWIERGIIKSIRTGSGYPLGNMNAFLSSLHLVRDGYILPEEKWMLGV